jgi:thiamine biosynthesis lipoprotein
MLGAVVLALGGCATGIPSEPLLHGETMGSEWTVRIAGRLPVPVAVLQDGVQERFDAVDRSLSTWRRDSALSRFNDDDRGEWIDIDPELAAVMAYGLGLADRSDGAYDLTVGPLVNLWGFGPDPARAVAPPPAAIEAARARVGWRKVEVDLARHRARKMPGVRVDLSSLGKGRGVDRVAEYLDAQGVVNYLIDLSGKLRARGVNRARRPGGWRWNNRRRRSLGCAAHGAGRGRLAERSIATSGDYRKYFESGGSTISHIIDPRTGSPVTHTTLSATAIARPAWRRMRWPRCSWSWARDALAAGGCARTPALWISRAGGGFRLARSAAWPRE